METYILYQKTLHLKKNRWSDLNIPVLFNALKDEFIVEIAAEEFKNDLVVEFNIKSMHVPSQLPNTSISVNIERITQHFFIKDFENITASDHLLLGCKSDQDIQLLLSIVKN